MAINNAAECLLDYPSLTLDAENVHGHTALWYAVYYHRDRRTSNTDQGSTIRNTERLRLIELLAQRGSSPNNRDRTGRTILSMAVTVGELAVVKALMKSPNFSLGCEKDLLHIASAAGQPPMIRLLYSTMAKTGVSPDINARDEHGLTPLHYAALSDSDKARDVAATLIDLNANLHQLDHRMHPVHTRRPPICQLYPSRVPATGRH
ncbi:ankyrin repeat-containing domain protein [Aspergillus aurantiobrunneus]